MKKEKWHLLIIISLIGVLVLGSLGQFGCAAPKEEAPIELIWDIVLPSVTLEAELARKYSQIMTERSGGRLQFRLFYAGESGLSGAECLHTMKEHALDMTNLLPFYNMGDEPLLGVSALPFVSTSWEQSRKHAEIERPYYEKIYNKWDCTILATYPFAPNQISSNEPITSLEDLKGLKIRAYSKVTSDCLEALGSVPVTLPAKEMYPAVMQGIVDATLTAVESCMTSRLYEKHKYITDVWLAFPNGTHVINKTVFESLPKDLRQIMLEEMKKLEDENWVEKRRFDDEQRKKAETEEGVTSLGPLPPADMEKMKELTKFIIDEWVEKVGPEGKELLEKLLAVE